MAFYVIFVFGKFVMFFNLPWFNIQFENESAPKHPEAESKQTTEIAKVVGSGALVYPTSSIQDSINVEG